MIALQVGWGTTLAIKTLFVLGLVPLAALILGYVFLLKMMSHMQSRLGPMDPGGFHGWYQLVGDGLKVLPKEDNMPADSARRVTGGGRYVDVPRLPGDPDGPRPCRQEPRRRRLLRAGGVEPVGHRGPHG